jgi:hypothetical protein
VRSKRRELSRAERAHRRAVRRAHRELHRAEQTAGREVRAAERALAEVSSGAELARYRRFRLRADRVETPEGDLSVVPGLRATALRGEHVRTIARPQTAARLENEGAGRHAGVRRVRGGRTYLLIETKDASILLPWRDDHAAREFIQAVNVAALNAGKLAARRSGAAAHLEEELAELRNRGERAVAEARGTVEGVGADTAAIVAARAALAAAEADTGEVARARAALEALEALE